MGLIVVVVGFGCVFVRVSKPCGEGSRHIDRGHSHKLSLLALVGLLPADFVVVVLVLVLVAVEIVGIALVGVVVGEVE